MLANVSETKKQHVVKCAEDMKSVM